MLLAEPVKHLAFNVVSEIKSYGHKNGCKCVNCICWLHNIQYMSVCFTRLYNNLILDAQSMPGNQTIYVVAILEEGPNSYNGKLNTVQYTFAAVYTDNTTCTDNTELHKNRKHEV